MQGNITEEILWSFARQRDPIPDSDLDNEQPITLTVTFRLGDLRKLRAGAIKVSPTPSAA